MTPGLIHGTRQTLAEFCFPESHIFFRTYTNFNAASHLGHAGTCILCGHLFFDCSNGLNPSGGSSSGMLCQGAWILHSPYGKA